MKFKDLDLKIPDSVYCPAEDSFILAEVASKLNTGSLVLEIGCGSGIVSLCAAKYSQCSVLGVDISTAAVRCATQNAKRNRIKNVKFLQSNLFEKISKQKFDAILFNPPYLPTRYKDKLNGPLDHAFDGGKNGRKVVDIFLDEFDTNLKRGGTLFLIQSDLNGPIKTKKKLQSLGYSVDIAAKESFFFEIVYVYRAIKNL